MEDKKRGARGSIVDYKEYAIRAAKELGYSDDYVLELEKAKTEGEVTRIMGRARNSKSRNYVRGIKNVTLEK